MSITERQDEPHHFERLVSYTYRYGIAGRWLGLSPDPPLVVG